MGHFKKWGGDDFEIRDYGLMDFEQVNVCWALLLTRNVLHSLRNVLKSMLVTSVL